MSKTTVKNISSLGKLGPFHVESVDLRFSNGEERTYYRLAPKHHAVLCVALDGDNLILINEYGGGVLDYELGFVKGGIDDGETPEQAAHRELAEEIFLQAKTCIPLGEIWNSSGYQTGKMFFYLFSDLSLLPDNVETHGDEPEPLEQVVWPISRLDELFNHPKVRDARNMVALYRLRDYLRAQGRI